MIVVLQLLSLLLAALMTLWALSRWRLYGFLFAGLSFYSFVLLIGIPTLEVEFGKDAVSKAVLVGLSGTVCFSLCIALAEFSSGPNRQPVRRNPVTEAASVWPSYLYSVCIVMLVTIAIASRRGADLLTGNWEDIRSTVDMLDSLASLLQFFVFPAAWIAFRCGRRGLSVAFLLVGLGLFPIIGSRAGLLSLPAVIALDLFRSSISKRRLYALLVVIVVAGLTLHVTGRVVRGLGAGGLVGLASGSFAVGDLIEEVRDQVDWTGGETEIARYFVYSVSGAELDDIPPLASVTRWLTIYLPRSVAMELKPEDVTYVIWRHAANDGVFESYPSLERLLELLSGGDSGSVHPFLWGEMWANGGATALVIVSLALAMIVIFIERVLVNAPSLITALVTPATVVGYFMVARGNSVIGLGYFFYLVLAAVGIHALSTVISAAIVGRIRPAPRNLRHDRASAQLR